MEFKYQPCQWMTQTEDESEWKKMYWFHCSIRWFWISFQRNSRKCKVTKQSSDIVPFRDSYSQAHLAMIATKRRKTSETILSTKWKCKIWDILCWGDETYSTFIIFCCLFWNIWSEKQTNIWKNETNGTQNKCIIEITSEHFKQK